MKYRKIGNTGLHASVISLGTEYLYDAPQDVVESTVGEALNRGINLLDMVVPGERTRANVGKAIAGRRDKLLIQGHICSTDVNDRFDISRDLPTVKRYFDMQLRALGTDYIDFGMLFLIDTDESFDDVFHSDILEYAQGLKEKGIVRHLGASSHNPKIALKIARTGLIDILMFPVNPAFDLMDSYKDPGYFDLKKEFKSDISVGESERAKLYRYCEREHIAISAMKPFGGGKLLQADFTPFAQPMTVGQCVHYALTRPGVVSAMCGCASAEEVAGVCAYLDMTDEERDFTGLMGTMKDSFEGSCVYCNHCEPCPVGIHIAEVNRALDIALLDEKSIPTDVKESYAALDAHGSDCIACGSCEERCPFSVPIIKNMERAGEIYGE